jgi:TolB-like protein/class 3 adenylate cyclase
VTIAPDPSTALTEWPELRHQRKAIVVVDVVESVRLMQANEADVIDRWRRFVNEVRTQVLPAHGGRLVKSLGDGLLLEFESVQSAVASALSLQSRIPRFSSGRAVDSVMTLRIGVHVADVVVDELDVYGAGVNLTARIATLGQPGEVIVSAEVRDELVDELDARLEDLGECYLKHLDHPVRAFRVAEPNRSAPTGRPGPPLPGLRPTVAVIPFLAVTGDAAAQVIGDALAEEIIAALSQAAELNVISRLSTRAFRDRDATLDETAARLGADYVLSGTLLVDGQRLRLSAELADAASRSVVWADVLLSDARDVFTQDRELVREIVSRLGGAILRSETGRVAAQPLPTLRSYSLLLGAITLMHRSSTADFGRAGAMLEHLVERERRHARPHAWLANWYALRVTQIQTASPRDDTLRALEHARRALEQDSQCSLALAIDGVLQINLVKDFDAAQRRFDAALDANPNEALAWLFKGLMHAFKGEGAQAEQASERALGLSPLDPLRYYYDTLAASAALGAANYERAIELARRSLRANRTHPSTFRALAIAQAMAGHDVDASETVASLLTLTPNYTVSDFKVLSGFSVGPLRDTFADALRSAGLPA